MRIDVLEGLVMGIYSRPLPYCWAPLQEIRAADFSDLSFFKDNSGE